MSKIVIKSHGDFTKLNDFFDTIEDYTGSVDLDKYGKMGVKALEEATPRDSGKTAESWRYEITHDKRAGKYILSFYNDNYSDDWFPVAIMLQYGHATRNGGYVSGRDYINPALQPVFDDLAEAAWKEVIDS